MDIYYSETHREHSPEAFIMRGIRRPSPEVPQRGEILLAAVQRDGHQIINACTPEFAPVQAIHDAGYLQFLQTAWERWCELPDHADEVLPNIHPGRNMGKRPDNIIGQCGFYQTDTACPIGAGTWQGALASAQCATDAARAVMAEIATSGVSPHSYALCRPPGHHAFADMAGGFCFLNNSAIAAQQCLELGAKRVAIVDVDVHHGNGTQGIFDTRDDVFTVSLHGDPANFYPFYAGYADETGTGKGAGSNLNVPLAKGVGDREYINHLSRTLDRVNDYAPDVVVVAAGLDASEHDPLAWLQITTDGFAGIGAALGAMHLPTVLVQEGGYITDILGDNLGALLGGFESAR